MRKNLETADTFVKLIFAIVVIIFYILRIITGPFAVALLILAIVVLLMFCLKTIYALMVRD